MVIKFLAFKPDRLSLANKDLHLQGKHDVTTLSHFHSNIINTRQKIFNTIFSLACHIFNKDLLVNTYGLFIFIVYILTWNSVLETTTFKSVKKKFKHLLCFSFCDYVILYICSLCSFHLLAWRPNLEKKKKKSIHSNKLFHNINLPESSFTCPSFGEVD